MAAITALLWSTWAIASGAHRGLFIAAWIATGLLFVSALILLFWPMGKPKDEPRGTIAFDFDSDSRDNSVEDVEISGADTGIRNRGRGNRFSRIIFRGKPHDID